MINTMTADEFSKDIHQMLASLAAKNQQGAKIKNTLIPEMRSIGKMIKTKVGKSIRQHKSPSGKPWNKLFSAPRPKVGDFSGMIFDGKIVNNVIKSGKQKKHAVEYRKKYGAPFKPLPALHRGGKKKFGVRPTTEIFDILVRNINVNRKGSRAYSFGPSWLNYGFKGRTKWLENVQFGRHKSGKGNNKKTGAMPPREILGLTGGMKRFIEAKIRKGFYRLLSNGVI